MKACEDSLTRSIDDFATLKGDLGASGSGCGRVEWATGVRPRSGMVASTDYSIFIY